jgi:hypothetical protein
MPRKTELDYLAEIAAKAGTAEITGSVTVGTVDLGATSLNALESVSVSFQSPQNVNVQNTSVPTFNNNLVNAGTIFSYAGAGNYGLFDAGIDADYVEFRLNGGGGGFTHNIALSVSNSPFTTAAGTNNGSVTVFNDKYPSSQGDSTAYRFSNSTLNSGSTGNYVFSLWSGSTKYRYVRLDVTGSGGGGWAGVFNSYRNLGLNATNGGDNRILNRVPIAGVVDINSCTSSLPVTATALPLPSGASSETTLGLVNGKLPSNLTVSSTRLLVDGSGVTQPTRETQPTNDYAINTSAVAAFAASGAALQSASFDAGANADYVVISLAGAGSAGAFYYDLSTNNSTWDAGNTSGGFATYYDIPATSATDSYSYKNVAATSFFGSTRSVFAGRFIVPLTQSQPGSGTITTYRYLRLNLPASNGGWRYRFASYKSVDSLLAASSAPGNPSTTRVAGRVDVGVVSALPPLSAGTNTIGSVNVLGGNTTAVKVDIAPGTATENIVTGNSSATANANVAVLAARANRKYLVIQNLSDTNMNLNFGTAASASTMLLPANGGGVSFEGTYVPTSSLNLVCSAASKPYYILEAYTS